MNPETDGIRLLLRALAEVRDGPFYSLWVDLTHRLQKLTPEIGFRISQVSDNENVCLGVGVTAIREDGLDVSWSVGLSTATGRLIIAGSVEITDDNGTREVFTRSAEAASLQKAAELIRTYASEVCAQPQWFDHPGVA